MLIFISAFLACLAGLIIGFISAVICARKEYGKLKAKCENKESILQAMAIMCTELQNGKRVSEILAHRGIKSVAIYGMGYLGEQLYKDIVNSDIELKYVMDQNPANVLMSIEVPILTLNDEIPDVDAIIITPLNAFDSIASDISKKRLITCIGMEELLMEL